MCNKINLIAIDKRQDLCLDFIEVFIYVHCSYLLQDSVTVKVDAIVLFQVNFYEPGERGGGGV